MAMMDPKLVPMVFALALTIIASFTANFIRSARIERKLEKRLTALEVKMEPFWNLIETQMSKLLIQPGHLRMDQLLGRLSERILAYEELLWLEEELKDRLTEEEPRPGYHTQTLLVLAVVKSRITERRAAAQVFA